MEYEERDIAVLNEAKSLEIITKPLPTDEDTRHKLAEAVIEQARFARKKGENGEHVTRILFIAESQPFLDKDEREYQSAISKEIESSLPLPPEVEDIPTLPSDFNDISDRELIKFMGVYNACAARANWLYSIEEAGQASAKAIADYYEDEYIVSADRKDVGGKAKTAALLRAEAKKDNPAISKWRGREGNHSRKANKYKRLVDHYDLTCDRLSRIWTVKSEERKHA